LSFSFVFLFANYQSIGDGYTDNDIRNINLCVAVRALLYKTRRLGYTRDGRDADCKGWLQEGEKLGLMEKGRGW